MRRRSAQRNVEEESSNGQASVALQSPEDRFVGGIVRIVLALCGRCVNRVALRVR